MPKRNRTAARTYSRKILGQTVIISRSEGYAHVAQYRATWTHEAWGTVRTGVFPLYRELIASVQDSIRSIDAFDQRVVSGEMDRDTGADRSVA